jgi:hypothetical protein
LFTRAIKPRESVALIVRCSRGGDRILLPHQSTPSPRRGQGATCPELVEGEEGGEKDVLLPG